MSDPEWAPFFIQYKLLKKYINTIRCDDGATVHHDKRGCSNRLSSSGRDKFQQSHGSNRKQVETNELIGIVSHEPELMTSTSCRSDVRVGESVSTTQAQSASESIELPLDMRFIVGWNLLAQPQRYVSFELHNPVAGSLLPSPSIRAIQV